MWWKRKARDQKAPETTEATVDRPKQADLQEICDFLNKKRKNNDCGWCGGNDWTVEKPKAALDCYYSDRRWTYDVYPSAMVRCRDCGHMIMFNALACTSLIDKMAQEENDKESNDLEEDLIWDYLLHEPQAIDA